MALLYTQMPKKKLNADEKRERQAGDLSLFIQKYGRKAQKGWEPNDRNYSRKVEKKIKKHLKPTKLDALLRDDDPAD